ncbi:hypothetical protein PSTT_04495 [Puccinia striiformis]|uniref:Uncharacterized protein n=1 Tax=Puccinia striiformis TaxID=27350 RepID=A0A2S4VSG9_9BASI|nr:hypothetical protein PSTT_04495 [Puccinia striiformis]
MTSSINVTDVTPSTNTTGGTQVTDLTGGTQATDLTGGTQPTDSTGGMFPTSEWVFLGWRLPEPDPQPNGSRVSPGSTQPIYILNRAPYRQRDISTQVYDSGLRHLLESIVNPVKILMRITHVICERPEFVHLHNRGKLSQTLIPIAWP